MATRPIRATTNWTTAAKGGWSLDAWRDFRLRSGNGTQHRAVKRNDLLFILRNLTTLIDNGVSLPKALETLAQERTLTRHTGLLHRLRLRVETGTSFSVALAEYPESFDSVFVNQVRVGEQSGTLPDVLAQLALQVETRCQLRSLILKKLSYPIVLVVLGVAVITFMLTFVVPMFEKTYADAGVPLPLVTRFLIAVGGMATSYGWVLLLLTAIGIVVFKQLRKRPHTALAMDHAVLRVPILGNYLRSIAVLQLMDVLGNLMESGFTIAEALGVSAESVNNLAVRESARKLQTAVNQGERFSLELERLGGLFPPVVGQLVVIGERTGRLAKVTGQIREHLRREIEHTTNVLVGTIEPVLTISLAAAIGVILLAIYLPMFDMIGAMSGG